MPSKSRQEHKIKPLVQVKLAGKKYRFVRCKSPYMEHILYFRYLGWKFDYYFSRYKLGPSLHVSSPIFQYFQTPLSFILLYSMSMQVPSSLLNQRTLVATLIVLPLFEKAEQHSKWANNSYRFGFLCFIHSTFPTMWFYHDCPDLL